MIMKRRFVTFACSSSVEHIPLASVTNVCVSVSPRPYVERKLFLRRRNQSDVVVLVDELEEVNPGTL